ncbi:hypothetical protein FVEN_g3690 [Fusarium venenatum]|uniref:HNH nuclease domain-containing protein n=1 Tax=Fusarium venenatum TaxID=56646 RepID=A0A2L2STQ8_9HYPO|nr:uncharacterized protein FVRRES_13651 [Fusarium venenatum]KAG8358427.1 hypothetical protein FVEN_g3690 [Fusarium venenatum]CEI41595.1 unnamed protein product [Fusarium venenatum]
MDLCRQRDGYKCIFLPTIVNDVAHIIPRSWNDTEENMLLTRTVISAAQAFMDDDILSKCVSLFADGNNLGTMDKCWNMLYINQLICKHLEKMRIGLKCVGIDHPFAEDDTRAVVIIQPYWLYRNYQKPKQKVTLEGDGNDFDDIINGIRQIRKLEKKPARVEMSTEDAEKCKAMLDLAWVLGVVAASSGAAQWPNLLPDHEYWDKIKHWAAVDRWVDDQAYRLQPPDLHLPSAPPSS